MKMAMAASSSCRRLGQRLELVSVIVAVTFFLCGGPRAAIAQGGKDANVFRILQNEAQFSMFYKALLDTTEIWNVEGRTQINGSQLLLFAPTNAALTAALPGGVLQCLQSEGGKPVFVDFLMYLQVDVPISPRVESVQDLLNVSREGKLWTVNGKAISVSQVGGSITLTGDDGQETLTIAKARVTDPTVTLIALEESVLVDGETGDKILDTCFADEVLKPSTAPPPSSRALPSSARSSAHASASSRAAPASGAAQASASKRSRMLLY
ncbi:hypothetical protein CBR_g8939 [Chara braunii]|uniref:FAS1 domain-containing protein n=1 Tax=Chara braunii TaxID=69332 RepID=A0A388KN96_CHABU|nr:hypothetical protein CBR_g8939 [Chara braunii]|eukprot:GBG71522.1 hypothetical protein CBR_g8939 [Chara braunii]